MSYQKSLYFYCHSKIYLGSDKLDIQSIGKNNICSY